MKHQEDTPGSVLACLAEERWIDESRPEPKEARVRKVLEVMQLSLAERWSIPRLSRLVNLSPSRLRQLFQREIGRSPLQHLRELRFERAEALVRTTFLSIKEISFLTGMSNTTHFSREFRDRYGLSPSRYRIAQSRVETALPKVT